MRTAYARGFRFLASGGFSAGIVFASVFFLHNVLGGWYLAASSIGIVAAVFVNFSLQKQWVFENAGRERALQFRAFAAVNAVAFCLNALFMHAAVEWFGAGVLVAQAISAALIACMSFLAYQGIFSAIPSERYAPGRAR